MTEKELEAVLLTVLHSCGDIYDDNGKRNAILRAVSFENDGVMTCDKGVMLELDDGSEFQITIRRIR